MMSKPLLEIKSLEKSYGTTPVLKGINLTLEPGMHIGLLGNNGQGKTTLIKLILGLLRPDQGSIFLEGVEAVFPRLQHQKRRMGYLPESVGFYDKLTGAGTLRFLAKLKGVAETEVEPLLEQVGLSYAAHSPVGTYSKGMRQRLGLAQTLLGSPSILLLDEPTSGLDPEGTREFYAILQRLKQQDVAILTASHLLAEIETKLDRMMLLKDGRFVREGAIHELVGQSGLPIQIRVVLNKPPQAVLGKLEKMGAVATSNGHPHTYDVACSEEEKIGVLDTLLGNKKHISRISVREPGLEEVVHHYQSLEFDLPGEGK